MRLHWPDLSLIAIATFHTFISKKSYFAVIRSLIKTYNTEKLSFLATSYIFESSLSMMLTSIGGFVISYMNCVLLTFSLLLLLVSIKGSAKKKERKFIKILKLERKMIFGSAQVGGCGKQSFKPSIYSEGCL